MVAKGEKITLWCMGIAAAESAVGQRKRANEDIGGTSNCTGDVTKRAKTNAENKKALVEEYEQKLQVKHQDKYSRFQIKLWAEMLATGVHTDLDKAPAASMFGRDKHAKRQQSESANDDRHEYVM